MKTEKLKHPFARIPAGAARRAALAVSALIVVGISAAMRASSGALVGDGTRAAIVSLELAGSPARALSVMEAWESRGALGSAVVNVWLDYPFLIAYAAALALAAGMASDVLGSRWGRVGRSGVVLAWGALAAGGFDAIENVGLLRMLGSPHVVDAGWSWLTAGCAAMKFALVVGALGYAAGGAAVWLFGRFVRGFVP